MCEIDKQRVRVILCDNVRNMKKAMDDMEAWAASRTHLSWLYTRVCCHSAATQTHLLSQGKWSANSAKAYVE